MRVRGKVLVALCLVALLLISCVDAKRKPRKKLKKEREEKAAKQAEQAAAKAQQQQQQQSTQTPPQQQQQQRQRGRVFDTPLAGDKTSVYECPNPNADKGDPKAVFLAGQAYHDAGRLDEAMMCYHHSDRLHPSMPQVYANMGRALFEQKKYEEALGAYGRAYSIRPDLAIINKDLGNTYYELGDNDKALPLLLRAREIEPALSQIANSIACVYKKMGNAAEAKRYYELAIVDDDTDHLAYNNLAVIYIEEGNYGKAVELYDTAIEKSPGYLPSYVHKGGVLVSKKRSREAMPLFEHAMKNGDRSFDLLIGMAGAQYHLGNLRMAIKHYERATKMFPENGRALVGLVWTKTRVCDWRSRDTEVEQLRALVARESRGPVRDRPSLKLFQGLLYPFSGAELLALARRHSAGIEFRARGLRERLSLPPPNPGPATPLRVGYVSSDFGPHAIGYLVAGLFERHSRPEFEVYCYAITTSELIDIRKTIHDTCDVFEDVTTWSTEEVVKRIRSDRVHVLVDLNGQTKGARLDVFSLQPAPIQVNYLGLAATSGSDYFQYMARVTDPIITPPEHRENYHEALLYMPHSYQVNNHRQRFHYTTTRGAVSAFPGEDDSTLDPELTPITRESIGLPDDEFLFCNFNSLYKIDPVVFDIWMKVLHRVPDAKLWLLKNPPEAEPFLRFVVKEAGIDDERVVFTDKFKNTEHIRAFSLCDLFLDTRDYNAHTTASDALWGGLPVLTKPGATMAARVSASFLNNTGVPELVAYTDQEYEDRAVELATSAASELAELRERIETNRFTHPVHDTDRWVANFEAGLRAIWARHERGEPPSDTLIEDNEPLGRLIQ